MPFDLVVFDLDGTLIDSRGDIADAVNATRADYGLPPLAEEAIEPYIGEGARSLVERAIGGRGARELPEPSGRDDRREVPAPPGPPGPPESSDSIDEVLRRYFDHYRHQRTRRTRVYPGVREGLARLGSAPDPQQRPLRIVATNKQGLLARTILDDLGLGAFVDGVLGDGDVPRRKPDPAMLEEAMRRAGASPERTLYVGDSPIDVLTARNAGVPLCLVGWGYRRGEPLAQEPQFRAERFADVVALVLGERESGG